jgi:hypothetical protein
MAYFLTGLVEALRRVGRFEKALETTDKALAHAERFDHHMYDSLLLRLRGEIMAAMPGYGQEAVQSVLQEAIEVARRSRAKQLELEAVLALCRTQRARGDDTASREMLAEICTSFGEDAPSRSLREARRLVGLPAMAAQRDVLL